MIYENADWFIHRWATGLLDADAGQREAWRVSITRMMAQHRDELLPVVVTLLEELATEARTGLDETRLHCLLNATDDLYRRHAALAVPLASQILGGVSDEQIDHLAAELEQRNKDYAEDYLQDDEDLRQRARVERYLERIERWTGDLADAQVGLVEQVVSTMPDISADWFAYRRQQQLGLISLLRQGAGESDLRRYLTAWWVDFAGRSPSSVAALAQMRETSVQLVVKLDGVFSAAQREAFAGRIDRLRMALEGVEGFAQRNEGTSSVRACA